MPPHRSTSPASPEEWLKHARSDLKVARISEGQEEIFPEQVCFHAQQAAEKAIKAVFLANKIDFPFVHEIKILHDILENAGVIIPGNVRDSSKLTPYASETRYPGDFRDIDAKEVAEAIQIAEETLAWATRMIAEKP